MKDPSRFFRWVLLITGWISVALMVAAAVRENFLGEWRLVQREYRALLRREAADPHGRALADSFRIEIKQINVPGLGATDRCVSCHNGIDDPRMKEVPLPHRVHSGEILQQHPAERFGCTVCHQGQGAATNYHDAKAEDAYWDYPLLPPELTSATCASCHDPEYLARRSELQVAQLLDGMRLYDEKGCGSCHKIGGRGGTLGRALDDEGMRTRHQLPLARLAPPHTTWRWHKAHFLDPAGIVPGSRMIDPGVTEDEATALTVFMLSLRGRDLPASYMAPDKLEQRYRALHPAPRSGRELYRAYCSACHHAQGQGSNYAALGVRAPAIASADFLDVASDEFILATLETGRPERRMPALAAANDTLGPEEARSVAAHLRAIGPRAPDRAEVEAAHSDPALGRELYASDCAACHGDRGEGTPLGGPLAAADRRAAARGELYRAVVGGMPRTAMPRYSRYDASALRSLLDYAASLPQAPASRAAWRLGRGKPSDGRVLYSRICAGCHGESGQGNTGPALGSPQFRAAASEEFVAVTVVRGRAGTPMPAFGRDSVNYPRLTAQEVLDVAAFVRSELGSGRREAK